MNLKTHIRLIKKNIFFRKKCDVYWYIFFISISSLMFACLPLITQVYIRHLYPSKNLYLLLYLSIVFIVLFIFKLIIDIWANKFLNKYLLKLEKQLKEIVFERILSKRKINLERDQKYLEIYPKKYSLFIKNFIIYNYINIITLFFVFIIMFFFSFELFKYVIWFFLIFVIYLLIFNFILSNNKKKINSMYKEKKTSFISLLERMKHKNLSNEKNKEYFLKEFRTISSFELEKNIKNRNSLVVLNQTIRSSITFFRILFLGYFGYIIIVHNTHIGNLIVGLLYITIFGRSIINILTNSIYYVITKSAIISIHKIIINKEENL